MLSHVGRDELQLALLLEMDKKESRHGAPAPLRKEMVR